MTHSFDTHKYIKALVAKGMKEPQAELIISTIVETREFDLSKLVTKEEFAELRSYTREQFTKFSTEIDIIKRDLASLKENMATKVDLAELKFDILKWLIPFLVGIVIAIFVK